ncbi:hypothetical protein AHS24_65 [Escherichia phage vB_EcoS_AHS24]|uniref:Uncharacterized protein n=1 Tax=Escherichia phage vB_EcoS_AHS24 TaxID=1416030 RepID=A0A067YYF9_9CAUD|nr:hypothetical protein LA65_gp65 [Escherichia phage vB_EcoS_AHS24]AHI60687.1 hypothetical protein AHS24_65 [Escherichia phage vB_EcoS_AHS24]
MCCAESWTLIWLSNSSQKMNSCAAMDLAASNVYHLFED